MRVAADVVVRRSGAQCRDAPPGRRRRLPLVLLVVLASWAPAPGGAVRRPNGEAAPPPEVGPLQPAEPLQEVCLLRGTAAHAANGDEDAALGRRRLVGVAAALPSADALIADFRERCASNFRNDVVDAASRAIAELTEEAVVRHLAKYVARGMCEDFVRNPLIVGELVNELFPRVCCPVADWDRNFAQKCIAHSCALRHLQHAMYAHEGEAASLLELLAEERPKCGKVETKVAQMVERVTQWGGHVESALSMQYCRATEWRGQAQTSFERLLNAMDWHKMICGQFLHTSGTVASRFEANCEGDATSRMGRRGRTHLQASMDMALAELPLHASATVCMEAQLTIMPAVREALGLVCGQDRELVAVGTSGDVEVVWGGFGGTAARLVEELCEDEAQTQVVAAVAPALAGPVGA